jgi:hypothetical protein
VSKAVTIVGQNAELGVPTLHASNFNSRFVSMSELELFLLTEILTPNFLGMDLGKILEKNQKLHIQIIAVTLKVTSCRTMSKKKK